MYIFRFAGIDSTQIPQLLIANKFGIHLRVLVLGQLDAVLKPLALHGVIVAILEHLRVLNLNALCSICVHIFFVVMYFLSNNYAKLYLYLIA